MPNHQKRFKQFQQTISNMTNKKLSSLEESQWMDKMLKNSKLTEKDAEEIGHKIKHEMFKRFEAKAKRIKQ